MEDQLVMQHLGLASIGLYASCFFCLHSSEYLQSPLHFALEELDHIIDRVTHNEFVFNLTKSQRIRGCRSLVQAAELQPVVMEAND